MTRQAIELTAKQRKELELFSTTGVHSVRLVQRAKLILALDTSEGRKAAKQEDIAKHLDVSRQTINIVKRDFRAAEDIAAFLSRKKRETPPVSPKATGEVEAHIVALACSRAPQGYARWTLQLLADKSVELKILDSISATTVGRLLKKRNLNLI